jgi:hypothetical protein
MQKLSESFESTLGLALALGVFAATLRAAVGSTDLKTLIVFGACVFFLSTLVFGAFKFFQKGNFILFAEWTLMSISLTNLTTWTFTQWQWQYDFVLYLDAFSRVAGMNLLVVFGFLAVTHNYKSQGLADIFIILGIGSIAAILMYVDYMAPIRPYVFFAVFFMFLPFLIMLTWKLFSIGNRTLGVHMIITTVLLTYLHSIADFYPIPGDSTNLVYNFAFMALTFWAYGYLVIYFSYAALERHSISSSRD